MMIFENVTTVKGKPMLIGMFNSGFLEEGLAVVGEKWITDDLSFNRAYRGLDKNNFNVNSKNYRSDEFVKNHSGLHILFGGCSHALGVGLADEERWSEIIYNKIKLNKSCSGYFNVARSGFSIKGSIINIFKYIDEFGKPDVIFFGVPEINRSIAFFAQKQSYMDVIYRGNGKELDNAELYFESYQYYKMLELFCKFAGIRLISFDSDIQAPQSHGLKSTFLNFNTYHDLGVSEAQEYIYEYTKKHKGKFDIIARDRLHFGVAINNFIAEKLYEIYEAES
jgi:hypothetical protein